MQILMLIVGFLFATQTFIADEVKPKKMKKDHSCCKKEKPKKDTVYLDINKALIEQHIQKF
jgi:hypothetical protein